MPNLIKLKTITIAVMSFIVKSSINHVWDSLKCDSHFIYIHTLAYANEKLTM